MVFTTKKSFMNNSSIECEKAYEFVEKAIETCTNTFHLESVANLIKLYYILTKDDIHKDILNHLKDKKWNEIHNVLK